MALFNDLQKQNLTGEFNESYTENGALGFRTSGKELVDFNFGIASMRNWDDEEIQNKFLKVWNECPELALKFVFFARDCRKGMGERRLGRLCLAKIGELNKDSLIKNLEFIPEYGRFDDLISLLHINDDIDKAIIDLIHVQLILDIAHLGANEPISLLGKWLPSENASSRKTKKDAKFIRKALNMSSKEYRQLLSKLRAQINIVERHMCSKEWDKIDYQSVPSIANLRYRNCFLRNDEDRRREFLASLKTGDVTINANVATPVDIVHQYTGRGWSTKALDETLEAMWKALPNVEIEDTLVCADGSGSMTWCGNSDITPLNVANALAIYTSERNKNFEGKFITFGRNPQFVNLSNLKSLKDKIDLVNQYDDCANTNIEKVFKLVLNTALENNYSQEQMPKRILIISDMEFDSGIDIGAPRGEEKQLFYNIQDAYETNGFKLPKIVFWNVASRTGTIPVRENDLGVGLVSGFSQQILKMVMSNKLDPFEIIVEQLLSERYEPIHL